MVIFIKKIIILILIISNPLFAQTEKMVVHTNSQGIKNYNLSEIEKITFINEDDTCNMKLTLVENSTEKMILQDIEKITFSPYGMMTKPLYIAHSNGSLDSIDLNLIKEIVFIPVTGVTDNYSDKFSLDLIFPLPSNEKVSAELTVGSKSFIAINIFNFKGDCIKNLFTGYLDAGNHLITWDRTNDILNKMPAGLYFIKIISGDVVLSKKFIIE